MQFLAELLSGCQQQTGDADNPFEQVQPFFAPQLGLPSIQILPDQRLVDTLDYLGLLLQPLPREEFYDAGSPRY